MLPRFTSRSSGTSARHTREWACTAPCRRSESREPNAARPRPPFAIPATRLGVLACVLRFETGLYQCWKFSRGRDGESKARAMRRMRGCPEAPGMGLDDRSADRQPDAHAVGLRREEGVEDAIGSRRIQSHARVFDRNEYAGLFGGFRGYRQYSRAVRDCRSEEHTSELQSPC